MADKVDFGPRIGADPEFFVIRVNKEAKQNRNQIIPVCGLVGGTKDQPRVIDPKIIGAPFQYNTQGFYGIQEDNVMLELNFPAVGRVDYFIYYMEKFLAWLEQNELAQKDLKLSYNCRHTFKPAQLSHPQAFQVGCSPDFHAYAPKESRQRRPFQAHEFQTVRSCGGHIHVQYNKENVPPEIFVKFMDLLYLQVLQWDKQQDRRKWYGLAGLYRPREYGIEYRTPSNFWCNPRNKQILAGYLDTILQLAYRANTDDGTEVLKTAYSELPWDDVQKSIDKEDIKLSKEILGYAAQHIPFGLHNYPGSDF